MKIKPNYEIKKVSDRFIVIPKASRNLDFNGIITLNKSAKLLFEHLQQEKQTVDSLVDLLTNAFDVTKEIARADVFVFIDVLKANDLLEIWIQNKS